MITVRTVAELREALSGVGSVGLVPTMGFFHEGHRSLMRAARANHDLVVTTIFVNPLQFGENEDLAGYPRDLVADTAAAEAEGVDVLFVPSVPEMYPEPTVTTVHVGSAGRSSKARHRPQFRMLGSVRKGMEVVKP